MNINDLTPDDLAIIEVWTKEQNDLQEKYNLYSENIRRAIDESDYFFWYNDDHKKSVTKLKEVFIKARKNSYMNKNKNYNPELTDEEFCTMLEFWDHKPIKIKDKIYFNLRINSKILNILNNDETNFVFKDNIYEYHDKNLVSCEICKERYVYNCNEFIYNKNVGCKRGKYKWHQIN